MLVQEFEDLTPAVKLAQRLSRQFGTAVILYSNGLYKVFSGTEVRIIHLEDIQGEEIASYQNGIKESMG